MAQNNVGTPTLQGQRVDPLANFKFQVIIGVGEKAGFTKVTGLDSEFDVLEYREGNEAIRKRKYPGLASYSDVVLETGLSVDNSLVDWHNQIARIEASGNLAPDGVPDPEFRRDVRIELYDKASSTPSKEWKLKSAWPCKLEDGELDGMSAAITIRKITICHEGLERIR